MLSGPPISAVTLSGNFTTQSSFKPIILISVFLICIFLAWVTPVLIFTVTVEELLFLSWRPASEIFFEISNVKVVFPVILLKSIVGKSIELTLFTSSEVPATLTDLGSQSIELISKWLGKVPVVFGWLIVIVPCLDTGTVTVTVAGSLVKLVSSLPLAS